MNCAGLKTRIVLRYIEGEDCSEMSCPEGERCSEMGWAVLKARNELQCCALKARHGATKIK